MRSDEGLLSGCLAAILMVAGTNVQAAQPETGTGSTDAPALEEIIVTAQKRSENAQDIPITLTAISPESLSNNKVETTADLQLLVPSLVYNDLGGFAQPYMRGIGSDITYMNADPGVATYIDGGFVSFNQATIQNLLGVQRVEVLAGPQGTLYGRNAVGGAINIITLSPSQAREGEVSLTTGNYARKEGSLHFSGGVTDDLALGIYLAGSRRNPYITNLTYQPIDDPDRVNHENQWGGRVKAVYTPTEWLSLTGSYENTKIESLERGTIRQLSPNSIGYVLFPDVPQVIEKYVAQSAFATHLIAKQEAAGLREEVTLPWASILGISNYRDVDINGFNDDVATGSQVYANRSPEEKSQQYSQELQLLSRPESNIKWITGVYFFHEWGGLLPLIASSPIFFAPPIFNTIGFARVVTKSYAGFAQATVPLDAIAQSLRLTLGGRYTSEKKNFSGNTSFTTATGEVAAPTVFYPAQDHTWSKFTPKVTLDYRLGGTLLYGTYSEGFKSGVYNLSAPANPGPVNPETLKSFEVGAKAELWDKRLVWNTAVYFYDWKNLQVQVLTGGAQGGSTSLQNAASAKAHGVDTSVTVAATKDLTLNVAASWEHSKYKDFDSFPGVDPDTLAGGPVDVAGNDLQRTPKSVLSTGATYSKPVSSGGTIHASANWYYNDGYFWTPQNTARQPSYNLFNATVGYAFNEHWNVTAWGRNLTNEYYATTNLPIAGLGVLAQDAPPRMYGLSVTYDLK